MQLVATDRYPIDQLDTPFGREFVADCARSFAATGALVLPGFLTEHALTRIVAEAEQCRSHAYFCRSDHTIFLDDGGPQDGLDAADPRVRTLRTRVGSIANDVLDTDGALQQLYEWPALTEFIGAVLGYDDFFRGEDPLGAVSINVYGHGDMHEWHFDESRFSVTIMIQEAEQGGHFEFVSGLRSDSEVNIEGLAGVLNGDVSAIQRLPFDAGSLSIFGGRNTLHRVTEVGGDRARLVPVLTYDTKPGSVNSDAVRKMFWGRTG